MNDHDRLIFITLIVATLVALGLLSLSTEPFFEDLKPTTLTAKELQTRYPDWTALQCERVSNHRTWIGMSQTMALRSLGHPERRNRSVYSWGTHEQWVYKDWICDRYIGYLYFRNGRLTSWQD